MRSDFNRIAIVNRGLPAMRIIHAVREFNLEQNTEIRTIALFTEPDRQARFVREADEAVELGAATFVDDRDAQRRPSYLDFERLERALIASSADAVWVGWGFVAERPDFADLCSRLGLVFIGPDSGAMRRLGDKMSAKRLAEQIGMAVTPWCGGPADTYEVARAHADRIGYPVVIKATAGAGGRGIRKARSEAELAVAFASARREASRTFDDATVFVERWVSGARHLEVQVQADRYGTTWAFGVRDCSIQSRYQKLVAEAPSPVLSAVQERVLRDESVRLCEAARYRDAAAVEFLLDPDSERLTFMEANPRLAVEHAVTELTTGVDLVKLQLHVARGGRLDPAPPPASGYAIEVRLNAEDPGTAFTAAPGRIALYRLPTGPGLRFDSGVAEGDAVPAEYGAMFAKLSARGRSRDEAIGRLKRALAESAIVVDGGTTNRAFLLQLLERREMRRSTVHVDWLDDVMAGEEQGLLPHAPIALLNAAIEAYDAEFAGEQEKFFASAARLRPAVRPEVGRQVEVSYGGHRYDFRVYRHSAADYRVEVEATRLDVHVDRVGPCERWIECGGRRHRVLCTVQGVTHHVEVDGVPHRISRADAGIIRAGAPAVVVSVLVKPGDLVSAGQRLAILEAMKMEMAVVAPFSGTVRQVLVMNNSQVGAGSPLVHLDARARQRPRKTASRVQFEGKPAPRLSEKPASRTRALLHGMRTGFVELKRSGAGSAEVVQGLRKVMLGFDMAASDVKRLVQEYRKVSGLLPAGNEELASAEEEILDIFVDVESLFGRQAPRDTSSGEHALSAEQYFNTYLRTIESRGADLPASFVAKLERALAHYTVDGLEPTPALKESLLWIFKARQRVDQQVGAISAILERRLACASELAPAPGSFIAQLDRLIVFSENRFPTLADLARDVRYRCMERPAFERARNAVYAEIERHLASLAGNPDKHERARLMAALLDCPQPLRGLLSQKLATAPVALLDILLEVLTRRYYSDRRLEHLVTGRAGARSVVLAQYDHDGRRIHLVSACAAYRDSRQALEALRPIIAAVPKDDDVVVDLHTWDATAGEAAHLLQDFAPLISAAGFDRPLRRFVMIRTAPGLGSADLEFCTFRPSADGSYREDEIYRGLHPMMAKRLQIWRLRNFYIDRLPRWRTSTSFEALRATTRKTSVSSHWPKCATWTRSETPAGASYTFRTSSGC
jgi:acetyl/propionyl-CoA carboxylase alpha subunit